MLPPGVSNKPEFVALLRALHRHQVELVVVGGLAAILEGVPMYTVDLDFVYRVEPANLERLLAALSEIGATYRDPAGRTIKPDVGRLATNRLNLMDSPLGNVDALREIAPGWRFEDLVTRSHQVELSGMTVRVLNLEAVLESKEAADRPKDRAVLFVLRNTLEIRRRQGQPP